MLELSCQNMHFFPYFFRNCFGSKSFCDFIMDYNFTIREIGLKNALQNMKFDDKPGDILTKFRDFIIVHLRFMKPEINIIDSKYKITDKIGNFGGIFGIFSQITGCSLLALLNLFLFGFKLLLSSRRYKKTEKM